MSTSTDSPETQRVAPDPVHDAVDALCERKGWDPDVQQIEDLSDDDARELASVFVGAIADQATERNRLAWDTWASDPLAVFEAAARTATALTMRRRRTRTPARARPQARESHGTRRGHARRATAKSGAPPGGGDDPPAGSSPPRLTLAPRPGARFTFGVEARERWGLA